MNAALDLVTSKNVKDWLGSSLPNHTWSAMELANIERCITAASLSWLQWTGIGFNGTVPEASPFVDLVDFEEDHDGYDDSRLYVRARPIVDVSLLEINGVEIQPSVTFSDGGYLISPDRRAIVLRSKFCRGIQNIHVEYTAGFEATDAISRVTIPATPGPYSITLEDRWVSDTSVEFFVGGADLTQVLVAPAASQYYLDGVGVYLFNAADQAKEVSIAHKIAGTPPDVIQAVTQMVAENYKRRQWIGQAQQSMGGPVGGSINLRDWAIAPDVKLVLDFYSREGRAA